ncbi:MAG: phosphotransferase [Roseburia sp.]|nr:phosphotransferase [Roseburia sp.]
MEVDYIIVQAGGKGTRMGYLTYNKPKALVPVENLPMLFHLFRKYPDKKYFIIGDYQYDVLCKYLDAFAQVNCQMIDARGRKGTCAGIADALAHIPEGSAFMLIWSDLILPEEYRMPEKAGNYIGIAKDFPCRWRYEGKTFAEERSATQGVAGQFIFRNKRELDGLPAEGEFVRWLKENHKQFEELPLLKTKEYGLLEEYRQLPRQKCRPFNRIEVTDAYVIKRAIDEQGKRLAVREAAWYRRVREADFKNIPRIYGTQPLKLERIRGKNIYEYELSHEQKKEILRQLTDCIRSIHRLEGCAVDMASYDEAYIGKTFSRLQRIYDLVPFAHDREICINGKKCANIFYHRRALEQMVRKYAPEEFRLIHGDCTFSNMMLKEGNIPILIDPRGYFGFTELYGDPAYDWVKLYYSIVGNYDRFNLKDFRLRIEEQEVFLEIESNNWEDMEEEFFSILGDEVSREQMTILHGITWLSLTTYAWEDYDSVCGAFYNGLQILSPVMRDVTGGGKHDQVL